MSLPEELKEPIDEIKTPSNRVLVTCLILAIMALSTVIVWQYKYGSAYWEGKYDKKAAEVDSLRNDKVISVMEQNLRLTERNNVLDSIKNKILNKSQ